MEIFGVAQPAEITRPPLQGRKPERTLVLFGGASGSLGYLAAFLLDLPVGASQTAVATLIAVIATAVGLRH